MYQIRDDIDINTLVDGRTILYLSQKINYSREFVSDILRGKRTCSYKRAKQIVDACQVDKKVSDYFINVKKEG